MIPNYFTQVSTIVTPVNLSWLYLWDAEDSHNPLLQPFSNSAVFEINANNYLGNHYGEWLSQNQSVKGDSRGNVIYLGSGNDVANGFGGNDVIYGNDGIDDLQGWSGDDTIYGGTGRDVIRGGAGNDRLYGDFLVGAAGDSADWLLGGSGDDYIVGGAGGDVIDGGSGNDTLSYALSGAAVQVSLLTGSVNYGGDAAGDKIANIERLEGSRFSDQLEGSASYDVILGGAGDDTISGRSGGDRLIGNDGADEFFGDLFGYGGGRDIYTGGAGADTFNFQFILESGVTAASRDIITDFSAGDKISVQYLDANLGIDGYQDFRLDTGGGFVAGEIQQVRSGANLILNFNISGDATPEMSILLQNRSALLTAADFIL
jgi:Ca2+-binding RTX toxin-like protein